MPQLPAAYAWLANEPGPKMIAEFVKIYGVIEAPGSADNQTILDWAKELDLEKVYTHDSIAWCGLEAGIIAHRAGKEIPENPLWALNWAKWGQATDKPMLGDILTFKRNGGGHVGIYIGEDSAAYHVGGGNQSDKSCIIRIAKSRLYAARRPLYHVQPANVRRVFLAPTGALSHNEA
jgi:uncharacterized protein (TIGR02594 family)